MFDLTPRRIIQELLLINKIIMIPQRLGFAVFPFNSRTRFPTIDMPLILKMLRKVNVITYMWMPAGQIA